MKLILIFSKLSKCFWVSANKSLIGIFFSVGLKLVICPLLHNKISSIDVRRFSAPVIVFWCNRRLLSSSKVSGLSFCKCKNWIRLATGLRKSWFNILKKRAFILFASSRFLFSSFSFSLVLLRMLSSIFHSSI